MKTAERAWAPAAIRSIHVSKIVSDRVTLHGNAGVHLLLRRARPATDQLQPRRQCRLRRDADTNFLVEAVGEWTETVNNTFRIEREFAFTLLPGVRHAFNLKEGQLVLGAGVPIQFTEGRTGRRRPSLPVLRAQVPLTPADAPRAGDASTTLICMVLGGRVLWGRPLNPGKPVLVEGLDLGLSLQGQQSIPFDMVWHLRTRSRSWCTRRVGHRRWADSRGREDGGDSEGTSSAE